MDDEKSVLEISVPEVEEIYFFIRNQKHTIELPPEGVPSHITLQFPWIEPYKISQIETDKLKTILRLVKPFKYSLKIGWFGDEVLILKPNDPSPFIEITKKVLETWPDYHYYSGEYDKIEPHVTIAYGELRELKSIADKIQCFLPISGNCSEVNLSIGVPGKMKIQQVFKL